MGKFCTNCGKALQDEDLFCDGCGVKTKEEGLNNFTESKNIKTALSNNTTIESDKMPRKTKKTGCGCLIVIVIAVIAFAFVSLLSGGRKTSAVDDAFLDQMNVHIGTNCVYTFSDHSAYYDEKLDEYIGTGSFSQNNIQYEYSFRAIVEDNTVVFIKSNVTDPLGNLVIDFYDMDKELEHLDSVESK